MCLFYSIHSFFTNSYGQAQLREVTLLEENAGYEKAISNCEYKIQEKKQEADLLRRKLEVSMKVSIERRGSLILLVT